MPDVIAARAPRRAEAVATDCVIRIRAELVSIGGGVLLTLCLVGTAILIMALFSPTVTGVQRFIAIVLSAALWMYLIRSVTEELILVGEELCYKAVLARSRVIRMDQLESMLLVHQGFNLERGIETIELRTFDRRIERISLGPCWQRSKLESFLRSVQDALHSPALSETAR